MRDLIRQLVDVYGPSGAEDDVRAKITTLVSPFAASIRTDTMGNLVVHKQGDGSGRRVMLAAHMDEIGLIVTQVEDSGLLRFSAIGFVTPKILLGSRVRFANGSIGVISHDGGYKAELLDDDLPDMGRWYIDMGVAARADLPVGVGDVAVFVRPFADLGNRLVAGGFDDRLGCAILIETLRRLQAAPHDIFFTFTVQEEIGARGAQVAAFDLAPEIALAVDVAATGDAPRQVVPLAVRLGGGPAIKVADSGMVAHPHLRQALIRTAETAGLPYQLEVFSHGHTDAATIQLARSGVISGAVSIPCRYVHTASEMIDMADVEATIGLLTALLSGPLPF